MSAEHMEQGSMIAQQEKEMKSKTYRNRIISVVSVSLVLVGAGILVSASRGSTNSNVGHSISNLAVVDGATATTLPMKVDMDRVAGAGPKGDASKRELPKEVRDVKMDVDPREIDGAKAKKTAKPTVKPTTPPKPTVPPTTKKPSEKKIQNEEAPKGKTHIARSLAEMTTNAPPKISVATASLQRTATTLLRADGPKGAAAVPLGMGRDVSKDEKSSPSSSSSSSSSKEEKKGEEDPRIAAREDPRKPLDADSDPCHDGLSPRCTPPSAKPVEQPPTIKPVEYEYSMKQKIHTVKRNLDVTKDDVDPCHDGLSPRCTPPTSKPVEHASKQAAALPRTLSAVPVKVTKDDADPCHDGLSPRCTPPTSKPVEHRVKRSLAGSPTKSPSSGLHKPTWKPSSKPNEHRTLAAVKVTKDDADPCHDGLSPRCTPPTSKPVEHASKQGAALPRTLSAVPVKVTKDDADPCHDGLSPRCTPPTSKPVEHRGLSSKTDKPSEKGKTNKPAEHASKSGVGAALPRALSAVPVKVTKDDADPCHDGLSPRCTPPTSKPVEHASKQGAALPRTLSAVPVKVTKDDADPCHDGLSPRCTPPTSKPVEHRGLSSKTDKPSEKGKTNKPAEHASKSGVGAALPRALSAVPVKVTKDDADPCHDGLSPRCTPPTSKPVEHASKQGAALPHNSRKLSSKASKSGKDSRPTMTPRTDKPSDRVV